MLTQFFGALLIIAGIWAICWPLMNLAERIRLRSYRMTPKQIAEANYRDAQAKLRSEMGI